MSVKVLAPGVYVTPDGGLHLDCVEMCIAAGAPPTPENQDRIEQAAREVFADCDAEIEVNEGPPPWRGFG